MLSSNLILERIGQNVLANYYALGIDVCERLIDKEEHPPDILEVKFEKNDKAKDKNDRAQMTLITA